MPVIAKLRRLRIAPRKVRLVADLVRGKSAEEARDILHFATKRAAPVFLKLLKSAVSNAKNNFKMEEKDLYVSKVLVDEGPKLKRWIARARGKANEIQKKTSHITIILDEISGRPKKIKEVKEIKKEEVERQKKVERVEKSPKVRKEKFQPETKKQKPKMVGGSKRIFRRTTFE